MRARRGGDRLWTASPAATRQMTPKSRRGVCLRIPQDRRAGQIDDSVRRDAFPTFPVPLLVLFSKHLNFRRMV